MTHHFPEPELISRRTVAAGGILALHLLVAYLLMTSLIAPVEVPKEPPPIVGFVPDAGPAPPPTEALPYRPPLVSTIDVPTPPRISDAAPVPRDPPLTPAAPSASPAQAGSAVAPIRVVGRNRLPNTEDYYPPDLRREGVQGATDVRVCVDGNGVRQGDPVVERSSGNARLDLGAVNVARHGSYARALQGDTPMPNCYGFRIVFRIH